MTGMILAAGFGTRLGKLTKDTPKALIEYRGKPLIARQIEKLKECGADEIVVNAHHHSAQIIRHFETNDYGIKITVLREEEILGTGGGIINAGSLLSQSDYSIVVNTDIETDFDYGEIIHYHERRNNFVTILIQKRKTTRYLKFNRELDLISRSETSGKAESDYAFNGVHIISKIFFEIAFKTGFADIIDIYLELTKKGYTISGYNAGTTNFKDTGKPENLV